MSKIQKRFRSFEIVLFHLSFDLAQDGELVEPFDIWILEFDI
jgi:hypothetical protein